MTQTLPSRSAVYAGTFDPLTNGHLEIAERALGLFERVIIAVAEKSSKTLLFSAAERVALIQEAVRPLGERVTVESFDGLLVTFVRSRGAGVIVRGLRAVSDYEYEQQMAIINRQLAEEIETVFFMTSKRSSFISASIVRQIAMHGGDVSALVPSHIADRLRSVYASGG